MASNFPTGLDSYVTKVDNVDYPMAAHINDPQDAIEALEAKIGIDSSAVSTSHDYMLNHANGKFKAHNHDTTYGEPQVILTSSVTGILPVANGGTGSATKNFVDLTNTQTIAGVKTFSSFPVTPSSTPTTNYQVANKIYIDNQLGFGTAVDKSASYGAQQATTNGFVEVSCLLGQAAGVAGYTDSNTNPTTKFHDTYNGEAIGVWRNFTMSVKKNDYWKLVVTGAPATLIVYWRPYGS